MDNDNSLEESIFNQIDLNELIQVKRSVIDTQSITGFLIKKNKDLSMIYSIDDNYEFDSIKIIRNSDITLVRLKSKELTRLSLVKTIPKFSCYLKINLDNFETALNDLNKMHEMVTFHVEEVDAISCYIGVDFSISGIFITATEINLNGNNDGYFILNIQDITKIEFSGKYEKNLRLIGQDTLN